LRQGMLPKIDPGGSRTGCSSSGGGRAPQEAHGPDTVRGRASPYSRRRSWRP
jgi:hypothetical protein